MFFCQLPRGKPRIILPIDWPRFSISLVVVFYFYEPRYKPLPWEAKIHTKSAQVPHYLSAVRWFGLNARSSQMHSGVQLRGMPLSHADYLRV